MNWTCPGLAASTISSNEHEARVGIICGEEEVSEADGAVKRRRRERDSANAPG
jgi:hypothetical protein